MSHGFELEAAALPPVSENAAVAAFSGLINGLNKLLLRLSMLAIVLTALVLTYAVAARYFFKIPTDWQDEASVFLLVGMTFFCTAWVQSARGHVGIEALASVLPAKVNAVRLFLVDLLSFLFCAFFAWKSWTLFHEAWSEGWTTSSTLAPPLWIPYSMMAAGMTILTVQILIQVLTHLTGKRSAQ